MVVIVTSDEPPLVTVRPLISRWRCRNFSAIKTGMFCVRWIWSSGTPFVNHLAEVKESSNDETPIGEISGVAAVGSILAAQEVNDEDGEKECQQLQKYGSDILDRLDEI